jgi:AraC family transcriptional regulator of adaptative response/methylated-DNA-[protein]-cysteine methyltransferase
MTFVEYARARRMGIAMKQIRAGELVIEAQLSTGYESSSGFRDAFSRIMGAAPSKIGNSQVLKAAWLDTPLGPMLAIGDEETLYLLEFVERRGLEREVERLRQKMKSAIIPGRTKPIDLIERELSRYFEGKLIELKKSPSGETRSYSELAVAVGKPSACRAVAQANGANQLALIIPCHRVINSNGEIGGYGGGITRKKWLLNHEKKEVSHDHPARTS